MASPNPTWKFAATSALDQDLDRGVPATASVVQYWMHLVNELAAQNIIASRADAEEWLNDLITFGDLRYPNTFSPSFGDEEAKVNYASLPFVYTP